MKKDSGSIKQWSRRLSKEETRKGLMESLVYNQKINTEYLNLKRKAIKVESYEETMNIIKEYEDKI